MGGLQRGHRRHRVGPAPQPRRSRTLPNVVRIALGQLNTTVGDLDGNVARMADWTARATHEGADVVLFPELAITGYPPEDLVLRPEFVEDNLAALRRLAKETAAGCDVIRAEKARGTRRDGRTELQTLLNTEWYRAESWQLLAKYLMSLGRTEEAAKALAQAHAFDVHLSNH